MRVFRSLLVFVSVAAFAPALTGQSQQTRSLPRAERVIAAGETFADPRLALSFTLPFASVVRVRPRGNFYGVEVESVADASYFVYHTTYRIRRPAAVGEKLMTALRSVFAACELPPIPADESFEVRTRCAGAIGLNEVVRDIRLIRAGGLLHLLHVTSRSDAGDAADRMLGSVQTNAEFRAPIEAPAGL